MKTSKIIHHIHHLTEEDIALYVDALKLDRVGEIPAELRAHVEDCDTCKAQILMLHETMPNELYHGITQHPYFDKKIQEPKVQYLFPTYRVAAAVAVVALAGAGYYYIATSRTAHTIRKQPLQTQTLTNDSGVAEQKTIPVPTIKKQDLLAANFDPSPNLENMVQNDFRSTSIEALSPVVGKVTSQPITFKWKNYEGPVTVKVLTNKEETVYSSITEASKLTMKKNLVPGLYYWKLETKEELLFVGKFIVK